jgi:transporter family protein
VADFAALVAIFAKVGLEGVNSDLAALLQTFVIIAVFGIFVCSTAEWQNPLGLSTGTNVFLVLSALATSASWVCYFPALNAGQASLVAPIDQLSVLLAAVFAFTFLGERSSFREGLEILLVGAGVLVIALKR